MARDLPNRDWLRVFSACAASESFAAAASQLGVTAGAVSQRIKTLEGFLGVHLFERGAQGVRLTEAGRRLAHMTAQPLQQLTTATRELMDGVAPRPVRITVLPAFAQLWLGPRLNEFHRLHKNTHVEIWADPSVVDLRTSDFDIAIRYGAPPFPGCDYHPILVDELAPAASPALMASVPRDRNGLPVGVPLNLDGFWSGDFDLWCAHSGAATPAGLTLQTFSLYSMVVDATLNGRGFMIGHSSLISDLVEKGQLTYLSDQRVRLSKQFYLLTKAGAELAPPAQAFVDWVLSSELDQPC